MISIAEVETHLAETGQFAVTDWLLGQSHLQYGLYEAWRNGEVAFLDEALSWDAKTLETLVRDAQLVCEQLKLVAQPTEYFSWQGGAVLSLSRSAATQAALARVWRRAEDLPQLDLFMDNTAVVTENRLQADLAARRFDEAEKTLEQLSRIHPSNSSLGAYKDLINYGHHITAERTVAPEVFKEELTGLLEEVAPLAKEVLKALSRDYLAYGWRRLARSAETLGLAASDWRCHPAFALAQIPDWQAVAVSLQADSLTWRQPELLCLFANAMFLGAAPQMGYLVWGQLAERFPDFIEQHIDRHPLATRHPLLLELWDSFLAFDEQWPCQWFLGYLLIQRPGLVHLIEKMPVGCDEAVTNPVNRTLVNLVWARIREEDQKLYRAQLKSAAPALLRCYMNKRDWHTGR